MLKVVMNKRVFAAAALLFAGSSLYNWRAGSGWNLGNGPTLAQVKAAGFDRPEGRPAAFNRFEKGRP